MVKLRTAEQDIFGGLKTKNAAVRPRFRKKW